MVTAYIDYGNENTQRLPELRAIARWMQDWAAQENRWHHKLIALGDFDLERIGNKLYEAFVDTWGRLLVDLGLAKASFSVRISDHFPQWIEFRPPQDA